MRWPQPATVIGWVPSMAPANLRRNELRCSTFLAAWSINRRSKVDAPAPGERLSSHRRTNAAKQPHSQGCRLEMTVSSMSDRCACCANVTSARSRQRLRTRNLAEPVRASTPGVAAKARPRRLSPHDHYPDLHSRRHGCAVPGSHLRACGCEEGLASADASTFLSPAVRSVPFQRNHSPPGTSLARSRMPVSRAFAFDGVLQCMRWFTASVSSPLKISPHSRSCRAGSLQRLAARRLRVVTRPPGRLSARKQII